MTTNGTFCRRNWLRDDAADAAVAADDEMILDRFEHTFAPAPLQPLGQPALDDHGREQREGVERRADAADTSTSDGQRLAGPRQLVDLAVPDGRHRDDVM